MLDDAFMVNGLAAFVEARGHRGSRKYGLIWLVAWFLRAAVAREPSITDRLVSLVQPCYVPP